MVIQDPVRQCYVWQKGILKLGKDGERGVRKYRTCIHLAQSAGMGNQQTKEDH
jgi:hypothetical protein